MIAADTHPEVLEIARMIHLENAAWVRRVNGVQIGPWESQMPPVHDQLLALAGGIHAYIALDRFPARAVDTPVPVPPFLDRLAARAQAVLLDRAVWIWLFVAFWLGRLL